jgi:LuxR family maltose regulon positive regulatory protein
MPRARLVGTIERAIPDHKLVLVSSPAGYGKTTLLTQWAHDSRFAVAWLSIAEEHDKPDRFSRSLLAAWEAIRPEVRQSPLGLLLGASAPDRDAVLAAFVDLAADASDETVFVLDDYHLIDEASVHQAVAYLLDHLPPAFHLVLAGRADPPLPLARYRARAELLEVRSDDLAFSAAETGEFVNLVSGLNLTDEQIDRLHARLEGWAAGLQLVSLTLRRRPEAADRPAVGGRHRFVADYLGEEVLAPLPDDVRRFLLRTAILDRLSGPLCDAVTGHGGGQAMLERLERENLFLLPLDDDRRWFRYHGLFADVLREDLRRRHPDEVADLHRRAGRWYLAQDLPEPAFRHAVAGDDLDLTAQIVERYQYPKLMAGEFRVLQEWVDALPEAWFAAYPILGLLRADLLAFSGAFDASVRCLDDIERRLLPAETESARRQLAKLTAIRCFLACIANDLGRAVELADRALRELPDDDLRYRPGIFAALGDTYRRAARWDDARACYLRVVGLPPTPTLRIVSVHVSGALADLALRQGRLREAVDHWRRAMAFIHDPKNWGCIELPVIGWVYLRLAELLYEWNDLDGARRHLTHGLERAELGGDVRARIAGHVLAARLALADGDVEAAAASVERARPLVDQAPFPDWTGRFARCRLEVWLAQHRPRAALDWADAVADAAIDEGPDAETALLALARAWIAAGDAPARDRAQTLLLRLLDAAAAEGRIGAQIEALALRAVAAWRSGNLTGAMTSLEHALRLAEPEGYVRLFADLGLPMARLLQEARSRRVMPGYVATLLAACGADPTGPERALPEPLSAREIEVLRLIAAGLTNREIAGALSISPETVKRHTAGIYGKLGAGNRTEAAARARDLGVLD